MATKRPNILWICSDSQRWDTLGCYGNPFVHTPNLDRLAREGVRFESAFAQNPLCTPSRGCFLTGRYPVTNRLRQNGQAIPPDLGQHLVPRILRDGADYVCGLSGKLHLSHCNQSRKLGPEWWKLPKSQRLTPYEQRVDDGYSVFHWAHGGPDNPYDAYSQWLRQKGVVTPPDEEPAESLGPQVAYGLPADQTHTAFSIDKAVEFIELHHAKGMTRPWLFSVNMVEPHPDFHPPKECLARYLEHLDAIPLPNLEADQLARKPAHQRAFHQSGKSQSQLTMSDHDKRLIKAAYWALCDHIDDQVGRVLAALERTGQRENTLVIFMSDHGELLGDHGRTWKGAYLYDASIRVPLIVSMPGTVPTGRVSSALVELGDLAPTVLDAAGLPRAPGMQARSLWPLLTGQAPLDAFRDDAYCEYYNSNPGSQDLWLTMVRTQNHKLVAWHGHDDGELYDLRQDPNELVNLWHEPAHTAMKTQLLLRMAARMAWTADPQPERMGIF